MNTLFFSIITVMFVILCMSALITSTALVHFPFLTYLKKLHVLFAISALIGALLHGLLAERSPAAYSGKASWICLLLLIVLSLPRFRNHHSQWKKIHRRLGFLTCFMIFLHIIHALII